MNQKRYCLASAKTYCDCHLENDVSWIILELNEKLIARLEKAFSVMALVEQNFEKPSAIKFYDDSPIFLSHYYLDDYEHEDLLDYIERLDDGEIIFLEKFPLNNELLSEITSSVEFVKLEIMDAYSHEKGLYWSGYIRHTDVIFETNIVKLDALKREMATSN